MSTWQPYIYTSMAESYWISNIYIRIHPTPEHSYQKQIRFFLFFLAIPFFLWTLRLPGSWLNGNSGVRTETDADCGGAIYIYTKQYNKCLLACSLYLSACRFPVAPNNLKTDFAYDR